MTVLTRLRKEKNIKQQDISAKLGIANSTYSMYESNKSAIPFEIACKISEIMEVDMNAIFLPIKFMIHE